MPARRRKGMRGASATSAAASKKMINAAESKKNTKPFTSRFTVIITVIDEITGVIPWVLCY